MMLLFSIATCTADAHAGPPVTAGGLSAPAARCLRTGGDWPQQQQESRGVARLQLQWGWASGGSGCRRVTPVQRSGSGRALGEGTGLGGRSCACEVSTQSLTGAAAFREHGFVATSASKALAQRAPGLAAGTSWAGVVQ